MPCLKLIVIERKGNYRNKKA